MRSIRQAQHHAAQQARCTSRVAQAQRHRSVTAHCALAGLSTSDRCTAAAYAAHAVRGSRHSTLGWSAPCSTHVSLKHWEAAAQPSTHSHRLQQLLATSLQAWYAHDPRRSALQHGRLSIAGLDGVVKLGLHALEQGILALLWLAVPKQILELDHCGFDCWSSLASLTRFFFAAWA
jgi:hypothetical protein